MLVKRGILFYYRQTNLEGNVSGASSVVDTPDPIPNTSFQSRVLGASSVVDTPDPIPNSAVKHFSTDGSLQWQE